MRHTISSVAAPEGKQVTKKFPAILQSVQLSDPYRSAVAGIAGSVGTLVIEAALGGRCAGLPLAGNRLSGVYGRGTTYRVPVPFTEC